MKIKAFALTVVGLVGLAGAPNALAKPYPYEVKIDCSSQPVLKEQEVITIAERSGLAKPSGGSWGVLYDKTDNPFKELVVGE